MKSLIFMAREGYCDRKCETSSLNQANENVIICLSNEVITKWASL